MSFWDHLEALRRVLIVAILSVGLMSLVGLLFASPLSHLFQRPLAGVEPTVELVFSAPLEALLSRLKLAFFSGVLMASPFLLWLGWRFAAPGLREQERKALLAAILCGSLMFLLGCLFAYRMLFAGLPAMVRMGLEGGRHLWSMHAYLDFCYRFIAACGIAFELPVLLTILGAVGLIRAETLRRKRPYLVVAVFIAAAILTPPDPLTQLMLGLPLLLLYEISILAVSFMQKVRSASHHHNELPYE